MSRPLRLALLLAPVLLELVLAAFPGHAQEQGTSARFAFSDTTLLRDTLGLHFTRLFPLADSLLITPDTLRAQAIRYRLPLERLVFLADSLRMPVDSVGSVMERERFNALALSRQRISKFGYSSGYTVSGNTNTWTNVTDYNFRQGPWFVRNLTQMSMTRTGGGTSDLNLTQDRESTTEMSWLIARDLSLGARVGLVQNGSFTQPASIYDYSRRNDQYQVSLRAAPRLARRLTTELSLFGGPYTEPYSTYEKNGLNAVLNGRVKYTLGSAYYQDLTIQSTNKFGHAQYIGRPRTGTRDFTQDIRSTMSLWENKPASLRLDLASRRDQAEKPDIQIVSATRIVGTDTLHSDTSDVLLRNPSGTRSATLQLRLRRDQDRYVIVTGVTGDAQRILSDSRSGQWVFLTSSSVNRSINTSARYALLGWLLDASFDYVLPISEVPRVGAIHPADQPDTTVDVDYREEQRTRTRDVEATLTRVFLGRLIVKATGHVSLTSQRYAITDQSYQLAFPGTQVQGTFDSEDYEQGYRIEANYTPLPRFSSGVALDVSRRDQLVLPAAGSSRSNEVRSYRSSWTWSYHMFPGLTVIQLNQLGADYTHSLFAKDQSLALTYLTQTNLNAVLSPRLNIQITHRLSNYPTGLYTVMPDGSIVFNPASGRKEYTLSGSISYSPSPVLTLSFLPYYSATNSDATQNGVAAPSLRQLTLTMSGGASLNLPVTKRGVLTGDIRRSFQAQRATTYNSGIPTTGAPTQFDYWNGSLQLTWQF